MLCTLDRLLSASALKSQATGIYKFFRAVSLCKGRKGRYKKTTPSVKMESCIAYDDELVSIQWETIG